MTAVLHILPFISHWNQMPIWKKQRITKVLFCYRDQVQQSPDNIEQKGIIERVGLNAAKDKELYSEFIDPIKIIIKGDTFEKVIDARFLMAETDVSKFRFHLQPVHVLIPRINGKTLSTTDLSTAYHQVALTLETEKPIHLVVGDEQYKCKRGFYYLERLPGFFWRILSIFLLNLPKELKL